MLASRTKIYIILEFVTGGELFDKIVSTVFHISYLSLAYLYVLCYLFLWSSCCYNKNAYMLYTASVETGLNIIFIELIMH